ncbi:unnamed protein product [Anisakis simplex]|uniref:Uncharacterized protein n=1 Tax=Anisakis simplex TaxID=6269 RepID=A0A0M3JP27_ANISI|nr:unnamed protein product [Anisakis simplex]
MICTYELRKLYIYIGPAMFVKRIKLPLKYWKMLECFSNQPLNMISFVF